MRWKLFVQIVVLLLLVWILTARTGWLWAERWKVVPRGAVFKIDTRTGEVRPLR